MWPDPRQGLVRHAARPDRLLASKPENHSEPLPGVQFPHQHHVGPRAHPDLQRRIPGNLRRIAPSGIGRTLYRDLGLCLACHRPAVRQRLGWQYLVPGKPADVPGAQRVPGRNLFHLFHQPDPGRNRWHRGPVSPGDRNHPDHAQRTPNARLAGASCGPGGYPRHPIDPRRIARCVATLCIRSSVSGVLPTEHRRQRL